MERTIKVLNQMKTDGVIVNYTLGGAVAALFYMEPIETHDLDVFISLPPKENEPLLSLHNVYDYLSRKGYAPGNEEVVVEGVPVQFLVASTPLVEEAMAAASERDYGAQRVVVMRPEYLVAIMVELNRPKDRIRLALFLDQVPLDLPHLAKILKTHGLEKKWKRILKETGHEAR
ncbi:MAG: hypothetical protein ACRD1X_08060 [Vicinamibacteria bacterium]